MANRKLKRGECKDIEEVTIQFENCETFSFKREDISNIFLHSIRKNISICLNAVIEDYEAEDIWFVLPLKVAKRKQKIFGFGEEESFLDRVMNNNDITHFYLKYNTGEEECISCVWEGDNNFYNPAQISKIEEDEYFTISISKDNVGKESLNDTKMGY